MHSTVAFQKIFQERSFWIWFGPPFPLILCFSSPLFARSFACSFVRLLVRLFVCSFVCSFVSFVRSFVRSFVLSFVLSFLRSFDHLFVHWSVCASDCFFVHPFDRLSAQQFFQDHILRKMRRNLKLKVKPLGTAEYVVWKRQEDLIEMGEACEACCTYQLRNSRFFGNKWCLREGREVLVQECRVNKDAINLEEKDIF